MSRILADKVTNYNNDGPFEAEKGINIPLNRPLQVAGSPGLSNQVLSSTGAGLVWRTLPNVFSGNYADLTNKPLLFSGRYTDLTNRPFVPTIEISNVSEGDYLRYNGELWTNATFPTIYTYTLEVDDPQTNQVTLGLKNNFNTVVSEYTFVGSGGIEVSLADSTITFTAPEVVSYNPLTAIGDVATAFTQELSEHVGISFEHVIGTGLITAIVDTQNFNIDGGSSDTNSVTIGLYDPESTLKGSVTLAADNTSGLSLSWDEGSATGTISWTNPDPYVLPTASTSELGGVKVDGTTITVDVNGIITANFIDTGIQYADLSVSINLDGTSPSGGLTYNQNTGEFTYTPVGTAMNDITDLVIDPEIGDNETIYYNGSGWVNTTASNLLNNASILDLGDVNDSAPNPGQFLAWNGVFWGLAEPIAPYGYLNFSGYPTPGTTSIGYVIGDPILSDDNSTAVEVKFIVRPGYIKSEVSVSIHTDNGGDIILQRRVDEFAGPGTWNEGTWTAITKFSTPSTLSAGGATHLSIIDTHGAGELDYVNYRLVADGNITVHYGKNNTITAKQLS